MAALLESIETSKADPKFFLRRQAKSPVASRLIHLSSLFSLTNGIGIVAGAWCLAQAVDAVMFRGAGVSEAAPFLYGLLAVCLLRSFCIYAAEHTGAKAALEVKRSLREALMARFFGDGLQWRGRERTGAMVSAAVEGVDAMHAYYARYLPSMTVTALLPLTILLFVFPVDWVSGVIMLVTAPLIPFFMLLIGRGAERLNQRQWRRLARMGGHFLDTIQGLTTLKLFNASRREAEIISRMCEGYRQDTMAVLRVAFLSSLALEFFATVSIAVVAVLVGFRLLWGQVDFGNAYLALLLAPEFYLPLRRMGTHYHARMEAIGAAEKIAALLDEKNGEKNAEKGMKSTFNAPGSALEIEFKDVFFAYEEGVPVLENVSFRVKRGQKMALIGTSGSGKSTVLALLLGFIRPVSGEIRVDGVPLDALHCQEWHAKLAWVPQRPTLFTGDVADNIRMANPDMDGTQLEALAQELGIDFLHQPVGERGKALSGGQVQRVAVARALAKQSHLFLLDEPTAGLDQESEALIQVALRRHSGEKTLITAAHRLHTLRDFDVVLELKHGRIAQREKAA